MSVARPPLPSAVRVVWRDGSWRARPAFTLIELLAVLIIASIVVVMGSVSIAATSRQARLVATLASLEQMDARGRMHARCSGCIVLLAVDAPKRAVRLTAIGDIAPLWLAQLEIPSDISLTIETQGGDGRVRFDRLGATADYAVTVQDAQRACTLRFSGLTGEVRRWEATP